MSLGSFPSGSAAKNLPATQETHVLSLHPEDPLQQGTATHSSIFAWRIPIDRGALWATVQRVARSPNELKLLSTHTHARTHAVIRVSTNPLRLAPLQEEKIWTQRQMGDREKTAIYKPKREAWNRSFPMAFRIKKKTLVSQTSSLQNCKKISFYDLSHPVCCTLLRGLCVLTHCLVLCYPMDCSLPGTYVHGIFQARIQEWVAISSSRGSFQPRDRTCISSLGR